MVKYTSSINIDEIKNSMKQGIPFYGESDSSFDIKDGKAALKVSVSQNPKNLDEVRLMVSGQIPVPIKGMSPFTAEFNKETTMPLEKFLELNSDQFRVEVKKTLAQGKDLSLEEIAQRSSDKNFSLFADLGEKFDKIINTSARGIKKTINTAIEVTTVGANVVKDSYNRAENSFNKAYKEQTKITDTFYKLEGDITRSKDKAQNLAAEIRTLCDELMVERVKALENGGLTESQSTKIELTQDLIKDKMQECIQLRKTIEDCQKNLKDMQDKGYKAISPADAAYAAKRESYLKDVSAVYNAGKDMAMTGYEAGKTALTGMRDSLRKANEKFKLFGKSAYIGIAEQVVDIGRTGIAMMGTMESRASDYIREKAASIGGKYQKLSDFDKRHINHLLNIANTFENMATRTNEYLDKSLDKSQEKIEKTQASREENGMKRSETLEKHNSKVEAWKYQGTHEKKHEIQRKTDEIGR